MADPNDSGWKPDPDPEDGDGILDILEEIFIDEDGEIRWVTIFVILLGIAAIIDWQRDWVWVNGIKQVVAYIELDMADPSIVTSLLA